MESLVFLSACLKKDAARGIIENLEPFANIDEQDGIIYYRAIITLKLLFTLHTMKNAFPEMLAQLMLVIGNVYVATTNPEIAVLPAISLCFQLFSPFMGSRLVWYITMTYIGVISMNIRQYEFILDIYVLISILWYAFETYNREIQKLCSVVSVVLTVGWYACKEYVKNPILLNKFSICAFLVLAYASLRPNRGNKHRHRLLYFYAIFFMWLLYQFHHGDSQFHVIEIEINKTHSDVSCTLGTDSMFKHGGSEKLLHDTNLKNVLSVENIDNSTCSKWHDDSLKDSISTKDWFFSESGKSKQYLKDVVSGGESTPRNDASKTYAENSLLQKSSLSNMDQANQKMTEINAGDKHKIQPNPGAITVERNKHRLDGSLSNIEETSSQVKANKNKDLHQNQNDDHEVNINFGISKVEPHHTEEKVQTISAVPAQNKQTVLHQINEEKTVTEPEDVSIQNGESELRQKIQFDFSTKTVDASSENREPELSISDGTMINIPIRAPEKDDSVNSNTEDDGEEILHGGSIDGRREEADRTPINTILDDEVDKEVLNNFRKKYGIVNVDTMKFITEETKQNIRLGNLQNLDVVSADLPEHDGDEMNNDDSKMLKNILNLMNFKIDVDLIPEEKLNAKFQDTNNEQSDFSEELDERDYIAKLYAEED